MYQDILRNVWTVNNAIKPFHARFKDRTTYGLVLLRRISSTYQSLAESAWWMNLLKNEIKMAKSVMQYRKERKEADDLDLVQLINIACNLVNKLEKMQEDEVAFYLGEVQDAFDNGTLPTTIDVMQLPIVTEAVPRIREDSLSSLPVDRSDELKENSPAVRVQPGPLAPLVPTMSRRVQMKRQRMVDDDSDDEPSTSRMVTRQGAKQMKKEEEEDDEVMVIEQDVTPEMMTRSRAYQKVKKEEELEEEYEEEVTEMREEYQGSIAQVEIDEDLPNPSLLSVFSKELGLQLEVPWEGMGTIHEDSNIGQPSKKSCPFCPMNLIGKRSAITKHVKECHKDLWAEFAPLACEAPECDYRATNIVTMKAHVAVSHGQEWDDWRDQDFFDLPESTLCPFCPAGLQVRLENLAEYREHVDEFHQFDVAEMSRAIKCSCGLEFQYTNELFFHWLRRGNTCARACLIPVAPISTPDADGLCWTGWSPCTVSCVPQGQAYFARQWRKQIACSSLVNYSLVSELTLISSNATHQENVTASFKPCAYKLPICQQAPAFPSVQFNNLVYMRILVLSLASLFVLIPTLIMCIKYRRHAHPFVWLTQHAASLRDLTERSDLKSTKQLDLKTLTPGPRTIPSNAALISTTTQKTSTTTTESKSKGERKGKTVIRNTEWSKVGKSIDIDQEVFTPQSAPPFPGESVSAHEVFTAVNIESELTKKVVTATSNNNNNNNGTTTTHSVDTQGKDERTQDSKTNEGSEDATALAKGTKSQDNQQEIRSVTQEKSAKNDVAPQLEGTLVKGDVGAKMEEKSDSGGKKKSEEVKVDETQGGGTPSISTPKEG